MPRFEAARESNGEALAAVPPRRKPLRCHRIPHHLDLGSIDAGPNQELRERRRDGEDVVGRRVHTRLDRGRHVWIGQRPESTRLVPKRGIHLEDVRQMECLRNLCSRTAMERIALVDRVDCELLCEAHDLFRLSLDRGAKRRYARVLLGDNRFELDELGRCVEAVPLGSDPGRREGGARALCRQSRDELPHVHRRTLMSENGNPGVGAHVEQPHQAAPRCLVVALDTASVRLAALGISPELGISPPCTSAACTAGRLAPRSKRLTTRRRACAPRRERSAPSDKSRCRASARPDSSPGGTSNPHSPSTTASLTPANVVLATGNPCAIASTTTFGKPSRSPFSSTRQGSANTAARLYSTRTSGSINGPRNATLSATPNS